MDPAAFEGMLQLLHDYSGVRYTNIAFLMLLLYDHAITFDLEVSRIWTLPWRAPKVLFLVNRYLIPPMLLFDGLTPTMHLKEFTCDFIAKWTAWPTILSLCTVELILILRVSAIYGHDKRMSRFLMGLFACELAGWLTLSILLIVKTTSLPGNDLFTGCLFSAPSYFFAGWIPAVVFESIIISLTIYKILSYRNVVPTLHILARDSIVYFSVIFVVLIANVFIARFGKGFIGALLIVPCSVIACIAAARMTMNIRELSVEDNGQTTEHELASIHFRPGQDLKTEDTEFGCAAPLFKARR